MTIPYKKLMGMVYQIAIAVFFAFIYFTLIVNLYYTNLEIAFNQLWRKIISIIALVLFHIFIILIIYCYLASVIKNPGQPPKFWVY